ncbi:MAG: molybdenum cofactor biosynthesis protein MoaE [Magnetococcales bacterium]|nr:molybdenum cofactor biosynthesis protein MoaE [Magnetococcales bacterium]
MIRIQTEDFSQEQEVAALIAGRTVVGGVVSFVGTVRDYTDGDRVVAMELEHYPGMTEAELVRIEDAARARFAVEELLVVHRVGRLNVADNIVLVVAAARHRGNAFDACRYMIDHLKLYATFWKKEITAQGGPRWVDACPGCEAAAGQWGSKKMESDTIHEHRHGCGHDDAGQEGEPERLPAIHWDGLRVGIMTLSDSRNRTEDLSGDALEGAVLGYGGVVAMRTLLPDEQEQIRDLLLEWTSNAGLDLILTTGGTGPGPRDVTPEATRDVCDRELPGFGELIRASGLKETRSAVLTRGVSAFRGQTLVINLPGSTRGALNSLLAVADLVPHALRMARGGGH